MTECYYKQFADILLFLSPSFPLDSAGVVYHIKTQGIDSFNAIADEHDPGLLESVELLIRFGKGR